MNPIEALVNKLKAIEIRRPSWEVTKPTCAPQSTIPITLHRVLALRHLELDVQEWTNEFLAEEGIAKPEMLAVQTILESHAADEDKHDEQLAHLATYWGLTGYTMVDAEANHLIRNWQLNKGNPLAKKLCLEAMVLFQAMALMQISAPEDLFTQAVRQWILFDEAAHVASARVLVRFARVRISPDLVDLGRQTVAWLTQDLPIDQQQRFLKVATDILTKGQSEAANQLSTVGNAEMFTQRVNSNIPYTARASY